MGAKISLIGTHGTGKTTLLNTLIEKYPEFQHQIDNYSDAGVLFKEKLLQVFDKNALQLYFLARHEYRVAVNENLLTDRSVLDALCYAHYEYMQGNVTVKMFRFLEERSLELLNREYNLLFWLRPEFELVGEGKRPEDKNYQIAIDRIFEYYIDVAKVVEVPVVRLTGSLEDRISKAAKAITKQFYN
jgi:deoxyadenosine/deoxycytidine kinase